jgi:glycosyltransferase involved in cell wall biosynthesis/ubiquinone/menaquinone biosynthesis C-methylase UbiE
MTSEPSGERFVPEFYCGEIAVEHFHRYLFAREFVRGLRVLDIACGDGYGTSLLSEVASHVIGTDIDRDTILAAQAKYQRQNIEFLVADCSRLPLSNECVDVIVSFETIEHVEDHESMLRELKRVLRPGGLLIMSSPDKYRYADLFSYKNPFHLNELYANEFFDLLQKHFQNVAIGGQRSLFGSGLLFPTQSTSVRSFERNADEFIKTEGLPSPMYCLGVASDAKLPPLFNGVYIDSVTTSNAVTTIEAKLQTKEREIRRLEEEKATLTAKIATLLEDSNPSRDIVTDLRIAISEQQQVIESTKTALAFERARANAVETSLMWRMIRPLRAFLSASPWLRQNGRRALMAVARMRRSAMNRKVEQSNRSSFKPLVTVVVPNFNHAPFLSSRLDSIVNQTYKNFEIVILDDASTDDSADVIRRYRDTYPDRIRVQWNDVNSGNPFRQWRKGIADASGELIWICESDDFAHPKFLERLVPMFADESVMIGFGRIQFANKSGKPYSGLDRYRERAQPGIWSEKNIRPAKAWFDTAFGVSNVIPNVGGCLIRNQSIESEIWETAFGYRILGDWYLYAMLSRGGRIAYVPDAVSWFRQHDSNTSVSAFTSAGYYREHERLICLLRERWGVPLSTVAKARDCLAAQFEYAKASEQLGSLSRYFDIDNIMAKRRNTRHVLIVFLGFFLGGGELFPIHLANQLTKQGLLVSVMVLELQGWDSRIRNQLDDRIALYTAQNARDIGISKLIREMGVDVVHSHFLGSEGLFFDDGRDIPDIPYVVTLHGSYDSIYQPPEFILRVARHVSHWVYLTEKNLDHLRVLGPAERAAISSSVVPNAMPIDNRPFEKTRAELGIDDGDFVFALVSRAFPPKGWEVAIRALQSASERTRRRPFLLLCGSGEEADRLSPLYGNTPNVKFLGFQERIHGLYGLADCAILPTRFSGESFPLAIIQALQARRPVIATDVGEIARMLKQSGECGGIVLPPNQDDTIFIKALADAMVAMEDPATHQRYSEGAAKLGQSYSMDTVADAYIDCYDEAIKRHSGRVDSLPV